MNEDGRLDGRQIRRPYWPVPGHEIHGAFAMFDWFDSGFDEQDFAAMHTTSREYAKRRLEPTAVALEAYRRVEGGSYHLTLLERGMTHNAFTDLPLLTARSDAVRRRYRHFLAVIQQTVRAFFDQELKGIPSPLLTSRSVNSGVLVQCYEPARRKLSN